MDKKINDVLWAKYVDSIITGRNLYSESSYANKLISLVVDFVKKYNQPYTLFCAYFIKVEVLPGMDFEDVVNLYRKNWRKEYDAIINLKDPDVMKIIRDLDIAHRSVNKKEFLNNFFNAHEVVDIAVDAETEYLKNKANIEKIKVNEKYKPNETLKLSYPLVWLNAVKKGNSVVIDIAKKFGLLLQKEMAKGQKLTEEFVYYGLEHLNIGTMDQKQDALVLLVECWKYGEELGDLYHKHAHMVRNLAEDKQDFFRINPLFASNILKRQRAS